MELEKLSELAAGGNEVARMMLEEMQQGAGVAEALNLAVGVLQFGPCEGLGEQEIAVREALEVPGGALGLVALQSPPSVPRGWAFVEV